MSCPPKLAPFAIVLSLGERNGNNVGKMLNTVVNDAKEIRTIEKCKYHIPPSII
ncbi:MAG: hypothetical protein ACI9O4_001139 [Chitinophagales bacterium]